MCVPSLFGGEEKVLELNSGSSCVTRNTQELVGVAWEMAQIVKHCVRT